MERKGLQLPQPLSLARANKHARACRKSAKTEASSNCEIARARSLVEEWSILCYLDDTYYGQEPGEGCRALLTGEQQATQRCGVLPPECDARVRPRKGYSTACWGA